MTYGTNLQWRETICSSGNVSVQEDQILGLPIYGDTVHSRAWKLGGRDFCSRLMPPAKEPLDNICLRKQFTIRMSHLTKGGLSSISWSHDKT